MNSNDSIETGGWDINYAMRFPAVNQHLSKSFEDENKIRQSVKVAVAKAITGTLEPKILGNGLTGGSKAILAAPGSGYQLNPKIQVRSYQPEGEGAVSLPTLKPYFNVNEIVISHAGNGYQSLPSIELSATGTTPAVFQASLKANSVSISTGGANYQVGDLITFNTLVPGAAKIVVRVDTVRSAGFGTSGIIDSISVQNFGKGYDIKPANNDFTAKKADGITPSGGSGATFNLDMGLHLQFDSVGLGYQEVPQVLITGGGSNTNAQGNSVCELSDIETSAFGSGLIDTPVVEIVPAEGDTSGGGAIVYMAMHFDSPHYDATNISNKMIFSQLLKKGILNGAMPVLFGSDWNESNIRTAIENAIDTAVDQASLDNLTDFLKHVIGAALTSMWGFSDKYKSNYLLLLKKAIAKQDYEDIDANYVAKKILKDFKIPDPVNQETRIRTAHDRLLQDEVDQVKNRVTRACWSRQADIMFNVASGDPTSAAFYKGVNDLVFVGANAVDIHAVFETITEAVSTLAPELYSHRLFAIGYDQTQSSTQVIKYNLFVSSWQLATGGEGELVYMEADILAGWFNANGKIYGIEPSNKFYLTLELHLEFVRSATTAQAVIPKDKSVRIVEIAQRDGSSPAQIPLRIQTWLKGTIEDSFNRKQTPDKDNQMVSNDPIDNAYSYNHIFAELNIFDNIGVTDPDFPWIFPTDFNYAVQDESKRPADIQYSILSICCMTEGRTNRGSGYVDIHSVPELCDTAIVLSPYIVLHKILLPEFCKFFTTVETSQTAHPSPEDWDDLNVSTKVTNKLKLYPVDSSYTDEHGINRLGAIEENGVTLSLNEGDLQFEAPRVVYPYNPRARALFHWNSSVYFSIVKDTNSQPRVAYTIQDNSTNATVDMDDDQVSVWKEVLSIAGILAIGVFANYIGYKVGKLVDHSSDLTFSERPEEIANEELRQHMQEYINNPEAEPLNDNVRTTQDIAQHRATDPAKWSNWFKKRVLNIDKPLNMEIPYRVNDGGLYEIRFMSPKASAEGALRAYLRNPMTPFESNGHYIEVFFEKDAMGNYTGKFEKIEWQRPAPADIPTDEELQRIQREFMGNIQAMGRINPWQKRILNAAHILISAADILIIYFKEIRPIIKDQQTKNAILNLVDLNGYKVFALKSFDHIKWPSLNDEHLDLQEFKLQKSMVMGFRKTTRFGGVTYGDHGEVIVGPCFPSKNDTQLRISNHGGGNLMLQFALNSKSVRDAPQKIGKYFEVENGKEQVIAVADFEVEAADFLIVSTHDEVDQVPFTIQIEQLS